MVILNITFRHHNHDFLTPRPLISYTVIIAAGARAGGSPGAPARSLLPVTHTTAGHSAACVRDSAALSGTTHTPVVCAALLSFSVCAFIIFVRTAQTYITIYSSSFPTITSTTSSNEQLSHI
jgi:hypothetical protein